MTAWCSGEPHMPWQTTQNKVLPLHIHLLSVQMQRRCDLPAAAVEKSLCF